ncbi:hypothetical protein SASPL_125614 [Salvia splendens]|uniref:Uncharacterized protein n=1 Tax=Salvia splendens TaxID=180675 RepID=A0A8X8ZQW7_SALSN|nr:hypothetical protein SASPL_125614 [Salvia splendens]
MKKLQEEIRRMAGKKDVMDEKGIETLPYIRAVSLELINFGFGRRGCQGMGMAMAEVELALANLVYKFDWELPIGMKEDDIDFECLPGTAMHKKNALCLLAKAV